MCKNVRCSSLTQRLLSKKSHQDSSTICYGQGTAARATRLGSTICYGQKEPPRLGNQWARKSHQDSAVRFVTAKSWPDKSHQDSAVRFVTAKRGPERATKTRQNDLLRKSWPERAKSHQDSAVRFVTAKSWPERAWARKSHQDSAVRFVTAKSWPERATKTRQYDLLRPRRWARKSHQDSAVRFVTAKRGPERATKTRQYDLLRPRVGQKEPPRLGSTICYGQDVARKSHQDSAVRFVTAKSWPERATKTRQYDLLWPNVGQKEPPRLGPASTTAHPAHLSSIGSPQPILEPRPCPRRREGRKFVGKAEIRGQAREIRGQGGKFVGKAENSWARRKIRGQGGKFVGKAENSWARRKIRGQGGQGGKFVGKAENSWASM